MTGPGGDIASGPTFSCRPLWQVTFAGSLPRGLVFSAEILCDGRFFLPSPPSFLGCPPCLPTLSCFFPSTLHSISLSVRLAIRTLSFAYSSGDPNPEAKTSLAAATISELVASPQAGSCFCGLGRESAKGSPQAKPCCLCFANKTSPAHATARLLRVTMAQWRGLCRDHVALRA